MDLQPLTLEEISKRFKKDDEFFFESYEDGFFTFFTNTEPYVQTITFKPTEFAVFRNCINIDDLLAAIDTNHHFGLSVEF